jgi:hypothetical protein
MKLLHAPLLLLALAPGGREEIALRYAPEPGTRLKRVFLAEAEYELTDMSMSVDGEPMEAEGELPEDSTRFVEHIAVTDTVEAVDAGRPTELARTFDELRQEDAGTVGEEASESTLASDLEGRAVRFTWNEDEERYEIAADDDEDLDEDVAAYLLEDMDLRLVLPADDVEIGDEWALDPRLYLAFMWPGGLLGFHAEGEEPGGDETLAQTIERLEGSGTARLEEVREEDGTRVAVITIELEITTGSESVVPADEERPELDVEVEIERTLTGTILWDLDHGHALSAELECESSRLQTLAYTVEGEMEGESVSLDIERSTLHEGTIEYTATIERE